MGQPSAAQLHIDGWIGSTAPKRKRKAKRKMKVSKAAFTADPALYSDSEWEKACVLDLGTDRVTAKKRWAVPVREPDGALNTEAVAKASDAIREADAHELAKDAAHRRIAKRCLKAGLPARIPVAKAKLTSKQRDALPDSDFIFPKTREYPYQDEEHARNALSRGAQNETGSRLATIRSKVKARYPDIDVTKAEVELNVPIWKDDAKRLVYGVVLTPGLRDSQGDVVSAEDIEKAAHRFLIDYRKHDVQHDERPAGVETVESWIAPCDMEIAGQPVLEGSWLMATHITDDAVWEKVGKGELGGYSIGGSGVRLPDAA